MTIRVTGPDGSTFNFPAGTPPAEMERAMAQHYGTGPEATRARLSATTALTSPTNKRTAWERFADDAGEAFNNSWMVAGWRRGREDAAAFGRMTKEEQVQHIQKNGGRIELNPARILGEISGGFSGLYDSVAGTDSLQSDTEKVKADEIERRQAFAQASEEDPWHQAEGLVGKTVHGGAALLGTLSAAALDPTSYISGGSSVWARIGTQGMIAGGVDALAQSSDVGYVQDSYNYGQTAMAAGAGAVFQGGMEGLGGLFRGRGAVRARVESKLNGERINLDQTFRDELDVADKINVPALIMDDWTFRPTKQGPTSDISLPARVEQPRAKGPRVDETTDGPKTDGPDGSSAKVEPEDPWNGVDWGLAGSPERAKAALGHLDRLRQFVKPDQVELFVRWLGRESVDVADDASHWNKDFFDFDKLASDPDKFEELANVMADIFKPMYDAAGDSVQTWKSVRDRQSTFGITVSDAIKAHADITGESGAAAKIHALETIAIQQTDHLMKIISDVEPKLRAGTQTADDISAIAQQLQAATMFDAMAGGAKSEIARALNIMKMSKKRARLVNDIQEQMDILNDALGGGAGDQGKMADVLKNLADAHKNGGVRGLKDSLRKARALGWQDYLSYYMVSGYLSTPATAVRNAIGSVLHATVTIGERYVAAGVTSPLRRAIGGKNASLEGVTFKEANAYLCGIHQSFMDASRAGFKAFMTASTVTDATNSVGIWRPETPFEYNAARRTKWKNDGLLRSVPDMLGVGIFGTLRTLGLRPSLAMDEFTKVMTRRMQLNALSVREASYRSARLKGAEAEKVFTRTLDALRERPTAEAFEQAKADFSHAGLDYDPAQSYEGDGLLQDAADVFASINLHDMIDDYARLMTFQNSGPTLQKFEKALGSIKLFKALYVPFFRTPVNLVRAGMFDRNPVLAGLLRENREGFKNYFAAMDGLDHSLTRGGAEADLVMARMVTGVGFMATAGLMFVNGDIVGKRSAAEEQDGIKSYSIRIDGRWYQYSTLSPLAEPLGMVADMMQIFKDYDLDEDGMAGIAGGILSAITNNIINKAALQGIGDFWDLIDPAYASNDKNKGEQAGKAFARKVGGSLIPAIVRNTAYVNDPVMREAQTLLDHLKANLPLLSDTLPERRDWLGLPIIRTDKDGGLIEGLVAPLRVSERTTDMVRLEVSALADADPELKIASRPQARFNGQKITPREHARVLAIQGQEWRHPVTDLNMHEALTELIMSADYADWPDARRAAEIKSMVSDYGRWSRNAIKRGDYPELADMLDRTGAAEAIEQGEAKGWNDWQIENKARGYGVTAEGLGELMGSLPQ